MASPQSIAADERIRIGAEPDALRERAQPLRVATTDDDIVGLQCGLESRYDVGDVSTPLLLAESFQSRLPDVLFIGPTLLVGQVCEFHRREDAVDDERGAQPCAEAQKEHVAPLVTAQRLHRGVVDHADGTPKRLLEVEPDPAAS